MASSPLLSSPRMLKSYDVPYWVIIAVTSPWAAHHGGWLAHHQDHGFSASPISSLGAFSAEAAVAHLDGTAHFASLSSTTHTITGAIVASLLPAASPPSAGRHSPHLCSLGADDSRCGSTWTVLFQAADPGKMISLDILAAEH